MNYEPIIGLEIHVQLKTKSKMFCSCRNNAEEREPNKNICPVCTGQPGVLPVVNKQAIEWTILCGLALNCKIPKFSKFDRKNYFYPDLPKGYQISQYDQPLCKQGFLEFEVEGKLKKVNIMRIHLEEDTGKSIHPEGTDYSLIDFNRAGTPLMEIVTEPDIRSAEEAGIFCREFQQILRYLDISDADMEKGEMRCEVNISLHKNANRDRSQSQINTDNISNNLYKNLNEFAKLGTKVEVKNLNSFRAVEKAIEYEIKRQREILNRGERVIQETRGWDDVKGITYSQREKEEAHDYRYFPEPDLPPLNLNPKWVEEIKLKVPELPIQKRKRFKKEFGLNEKDIRVLISDLDLADYFEEVVSELEEWFSLEKEPVKHKEAVKLTCNYLLSKLLKHLNEKDQSITECKITPENFAEFISLIRKGEIGSAAAREVLEEMFEKGSDPSQIIEQKGLKQVSDVVELDKVVDKVIKENKKPVDDYKSGHQNALQFLMGKVMKDTKGNANPGIVIRILKDKLR